MIWSPPTPPARKSIILKRASNIEYFSTPDILGGDMYVYVEGGGPKCGVSGVSQTNNYKAAMEQNIHGEM